MVAARTKQTIGICGSFLIFLFFVCKTVVNDLVFQFFAVEDRSISIGNHERIGMHANSGQNFIISRVDFTVAIHLIAEKIGQNKN